MNRTATTLPLGLPRTRSARVATAVLAAGLMTPAALTAAGATSAGATTPSLSHVVVTSLAGSVDGASRAAAAVRAAGGRVLADLPLIGGVSAALPTGTVLAPSYRVVADRTLTVSGRNDTSETTDSSLSVRAALGLGGPAGEGKNMTVAVVDTGVTEVADLAGRVTHLYAAAGTSTGDQYGHGTFVAGLIAGSGESSNGQYAGVAPAARILDVKVADASGSTSLTEVLMGLQAVEAAHPNVVNLSLSSGSFLPYQIDPLTVALEQLWRDGITVVVPSGNDPSGVSSPGNDPTLLTVGGLDPNGTAERSDDTVADWSGRSRGPKDAKPDLVAPGAHVVSLAVPGSVIDQAHPSAEVPGGYFRGSGTSFSTAVTSGAAAAILSKRPQLSPDELKAVLRGSTYRTHSLTRPRGAGEGALDLTAAYDAAPTDVQDSSATPIPGDAAIWQAYIDAVLAHDAAAAASSWSQLSQAAKNWAASSWSQLSADAKNWAAKNWAASSWSQYFPANGDWAAKNWAASSWSAKNWAASSWSAKNWAASSWSAKNWAAMDWDAKNWAASSWSAKNWAASSWSAKNWAAANWAAANWAAQGWS